MLSSLGRPDAPQHAMGLTIFADKHIVTNQYDINYSAVVCRSFRCGFLGRIRASSGRFAFEHSRKSIRVFLASFRTIAPSHYSSDLSPRVLGSADRGADRASAAECVSPSSVVAPLRSTLEETGWNVGFLSSQRRDDYRALQDCLYSFGQCGGCIKTISGGLRSAGHQVFPRNSGILNRSQLY